MPRVASNMLKILSTLLAVFVSTAVHAQDEAPTKTWKPFWGERLTGYVTARDGTKLRYSALLPTSPGKHPVLIKYSGYNSGAIGGSAYLNDEETFSVSLDKDLVDQGYAVVGVQARGTGCSEGDFDFLGNNYGTDGRDAVEFFSSQAWADGSVGMVGWSWGGMSQLMTASERPKGLKAIAPGMVLGDARADSFAPGGIPSARFYTEWQLFVDDAWNGIEKSAQHANDKQCLAQLQKNRKSILNNVVARKLLQHPYRDEWVDEQTIRDRTHKIEVPVLSMKAWQDEAVVSREGYYQDTLDPNKLWLVQTNGPHDLYESLYYRKKLIRFFDHFVKGKANGFDKEPHVEIWQESYATDTPDLHELNESAKPGWTIYRDHYPVSVVPAYFALTGSSQLLQGTQPNDPPQSFDYPVPAPIVNPWENRNWGALSADWKKGSLAFTTPAFEKDFVAYGPGSADIWFTADTVPDFDVQVTITQLLPDGQEVYIQRGWLRMSSRKLDEEKSTELRPWRIDRLDAVEPIPLNQPVLGRIEVQPFSHVFRAGSKLRLWIEAPSRTGEYTFDIFSIPTTIQVLHDKDHPSRLVIGELQKVAVSAKQPDCGSLLMQPCRKDPLSN